jgi:large subunit ribosomal protein L2
MKSYNPTTPARRQYQTADYSVLTKTEPLRSLLKPLKKHAGRNIMGRITVRHRGGGAKRLYRIIDFKQGALGKTGRVETIEYDPNRTAFITRVLWQNGERSYILAPQDITIGQKVIVGEQSPFSTGNRMKLKYIPVGTQVHNIELTPGQGGALARSAGSYAEVMAQEGKYTNLKLPSREIRKVLSEGFASIGQLSRAEHSLVSLGKAGRVRWMGIRPTVRGSAMNPRDHPYGGGEGRAPRGTRKPKTKWGKVTGGRKTRKNKKWSNKLIMQRRIKK